MVCFNFSKNFHNLCKRKHYIFAYLPDYLRHFQNVTSFKNTVPEVSNHPIIMLISRAWLLFNTDVNDTLKKLKVLLKQAVIIMALFLRTMKMTNVGSSCVGFSFRRLDLRHSRVSYFSMSSQSSSQFSPFNRISTMFATRKNIFFNHKRHNMPAFPKPTSCTIQAQITN